MKETVKPESKFDPDLIPEPVDIEDVIYSLMVNPNLSTINYFNDFGEAGYIPDLTDNEENEEIGFFDIDGCETSMVLSTHAFHHHLQIDPEKATEILVSRAARKMLCIGAEPEAVSALLYHINFADVKGQYIASGAKRGLENAASKFGLKISDRKIRFDHFSEHGPVTPTIIISMVGMVKDRSKIISHSLKKKGNNIFMIGRPVDDIGTSEYLEFYHKIADSPLPAFNIENEILIHKALRGLHREELLMSASPVGKGGLFFTLLRAAIPSGLGFDITTDAETRIDSFLFGEAMGRILVGVSSEKINRFVDFMTEIKVPFFTLGHVTRGKIKIDDKVLGYSDKMTPKS